MDRVPSSHGYSGFARCGRREVKQHAPACQRRDEASVAELTQQRLQFRESVLEDLASHNSIAGAVSGRRTTLGTSASTPRMPPEK